MASFLWWSLFQVFHPAFRCFNTIQKVCETVSGFVHVQLGRRDNTILYRQKQLLGFQNKHFLYFLTIKAYWFEEWSLRDTVFVWMATSRKQVTNRRFIQFLVLLTRFKSSLKLIKSIKMQTFKTSIEWPVENNIITGITTSQTIL